MRGYPEPVIRCWLGDNHKERWSNRLRSNSDGDERANVLVLKTHFNHAWQHFHVKEFGDRITAYWIEWLRLFESGQLPRPGFPKFDDGPLVLAPNDPAMGVGTQRGITPRVLDLRRTDIPSARWLVSRKRNSNLLDLTSLWKRAVLQGLDDDVWPQLAESSLDGDSVMASVSD
jgi:hypothetical protein